VYDEDGAEQYAGSAEVWIRGRSSSRVSKPGYGVELPASVNLLGMGAERDWVVDGLYYDRLLVRDKLGYDLLRELGEAAAESSLCELTLNGAYFGVHALVERIERDDDRVDIEDGALTGDAFVVTQTDHECFYTNAVTYGCWKLVSPNETDLGDLEESALWEGFAAWERAVYRAEPVADHVDVDSAVNAVLIEEFFKNEDAFYTSMHAWKNTAGTIHFLPWDLDMTFGQFPYYGNGDYARHDVWIGYRPELWSWMADDPVFSARLSERWAELRAGPLSDESWPARIDHLQSILGPAIDRNDAVWPIESINYGTYFYEVDSYADEDAHVRDWIALRLAWMDEHLADW
jgi:spore coat protein H